MTAERQADRPEALHAELAGLVLSQETGSSLLDTIVELATMAVAGVDGASISLADEQGRLETRSASAQAIRLVDEGQYTGGSGPCVEAIRTGAEVTITLPTDRWPTFSFLALEAGLHSVLSLPLRVRERTTGALNLYSAGEEPIASGPAEGARALARHAAVVLANATALSRAELTSRQLEEALASRDLIGQAKGILMAREGLDADEAFHLLRRRSQATGRKLRDIAAEVAADPRS